MIEPAIMTALSIFLTVTFFFLTYGAAYFIVMMTINFVRKIKEKLKENEDAT